MYLYADESRIRRTAFKSKLCFIFVKQSRIKALLRQNYGNDIPQICKNLRHLCVLFLSDLVFL
jgi:hypothetical protein